MNIMMMVINLFFAVFLGIVLALAIICAASVFVGVIHKLTEGAEDEEDDNDSGD